MAGLINLRLLTDFFNKIGHERRFHDVRDRSVHTLISDIPARSRNGREGPILLKNALVETVKVH